MSRPAPLRNTTNTIRMKTRVLSSIAIWGTIAATLALWKIWAGLAILLLTTAAAHYEFCVILGKCGGRPPRTALSVSLGVTVMAMLAWSALAPESSPVRVAGGGAWDAYKVAVPGLAIGAISLALLLTGPKRLIALFTAAPTAASWLLVPCSMAPLAFLAAERWGNTAGAGGFLRGDVSGLLLALWIVAVVKFADCGGLVVGCAFGRHKMAPSISPAKSWEGCAGALVFAAATGAVLAWLFGVFHDVLGWGAALTAAFTPAKAALLALALAALGIPSDLIESAFKRKAGVKDSGATIPGIGGAFDLLDSLLLTAPVGYVLLKWLFLP